MEAIIQVRDLSFAYPDGHQALRDVSLTVAPGEKVALGGAERRGQVHADAASQRNPASRFGRGACRRVGCAGQQSAARRGAVGLVFQDPDDQLFSPRVFDDVAFGPIYQGLRPAEVRERVAAALEAVHMGHMAERVSHHLSTGEKKRIAMATVLAMEPAILVLDEPTAGLDPRARRGLIHLLRELPQAMLVASHDLRMVQELLPRTIVMDDGAIVADGLTADILSDAALLEAHGLEVY